MRARDCAAFDPIPITIHPRFPLTRLPPDLSSPPVRGDRDFASPCTDERTTGEVVEGRVVDEITAPLVAVEWEDITAYSRTALPDDFEPYRLRKLTCGLLWKDTAEYIVVVGDYDISNEGRDYRHNDFHIIPRGVIRQLTYLRETTAPLVSLQVEAS
jgi:hypothetical protein